jgi:hypothetical protein
MTYEHRRMKTQDLRVFDLDPTWTLNGGFRAVGPWLDPGLRVGNPHAFAHTRAVVSALQIPVRAILFGENSKIPI